MKNRVLLIFFIFFCAWLGLIAKGIFLQVLPNPRLADLKKKQFEKMVTLQPRRGVISDRKGKELAVTVPSYSLFADPSLVAQPKTLSSKVSQLLGISYSKTYKSLANKKRRFVWIKRQLDEKKKTIISQWGFKGLGFIEESKRVYPSDNVLGQILGFVGRDGQGLEGLEHSFDNYLGGNKQKMQFRRDARGRPLLINGQIFSEFPDGANLHLTIDANVQFFLERELQHAIDYQDADSALGIVVDSNTGEIIAAANSPTFNPNLPGHFSAVNRKNRLFLDAFEPGSTMKTFVVAAALQEKLAKPNSKYFCEDGRFEIGNRVITEADSHHKFGWLTVSEILAKSSNIGSAKLAFQLGEQKLRDTLLDLGFGQKFNLTYGSEAHGILQKLPWGKHLTSNIAFGHGVSATALQVAMAYAAIANGGKLLQPLLVNKIETPMGEIIEEFEPKVVRQVFSESVSSTMRLMLMAATAKSATGYPARVKGFPVAGKTGTAQKVDHVRGGYKKGEYIASFAGFVPANKPKYVIYVVVDNPRKEYYGSQVAAPIFSKVASYLVRQAGLEPILISNKDIVEDTSLATPRPPTKELLSWEGNQIPDLKGLTLREVLYKLRGKELAVDIRGSGKVISTWPPAGQNIPKSKRLVLKLNNEN